MVDVFVYPSNKWILTPNVAWQSGFGKTFWNFILKLTLYPLTVGIIGSCSVGWTGNLLKLQVTQERQSWIKTAKFKHMLLLSNIKT